MKMNEALKQLRQIRNECEDYQLSGLLTDILDVYADEAPDDEDEDETVP
jgi:hypothetical protein